MAFSLRKIFNAPLLAPLVDPVRAVAAFSTVLLDSHIAGAKNAYNDTLDNGGSMANGFMAAWRDVFSRALDGTPGKNTHDEMGRMTLLGAAGFLFSTIGLGSVINGIAGVGWAGWAAIPLTAPFGILAAPFAVMCVIGAGSAVVGAAVFALPACLGGIAKAASSIYDPQGYEAKQRLRQQKVARAKIARARTNQPAKMPDGAEITDAIATLNDQRRQALFADLEGKFKGDFDVVRGREIDDMVERGLPQETTAPGIPDLKKKPFTPGQTGAEKQA